MTQIQLFTYEIATHNTKKLAENLKKLGASASEMKEDEYFTLQANVVKGILSDVVGKESVPDALKILMAPEFYFKYQDGMPYNRLAFFNTSLEYLKAISLGFPDILILPGTIWWCEPAKNEDKVVIHNTAPVFFGGNMIHTWQKERLSTIDGLKEAQQEWDRDAIGGKEILEDTQSPFFELWWKGAKIQCGLEVCLDHAKGALIQRYKKDYPRGCGVDIHFLIAAGMNVHDENIAARFGGIFCGIDGGQMIVDGRSCRSQCFEIRKSQSPIAVKIKAFGKNVDKDDRVAIFEPAEFCIE